MSAKKKSPVSNSGGQPALKIGSRVRCTDDGVEGRIVWCNAVSVKVRWDDGEEVTWRRDSLVERPIEILAETGDEGQAASPPAPAIPEPTERIESPQAEPEPATHRRRADRQGHRGVPRRPSTGTSRPRKTWSSRTTSTC